MLRICVLLLVLGEVRSAVALDPRKALTQYSTSVWTQQQGLPQDTIRSITQTTDGYLWLATDEGLARFDGYEFKVFTRDRGDLPSNSITSLAAGSDGSLWIGSTSGLTRYKDERFYSYGRKDGLPDGGISALFVDHTGILWAAAGGNLSRFDGKTFTNFLRERDIPLTSVRAVTEDRQHNLLIVGNSSVIRREGGKFVRLIEPSALTGDFPSGVQVDHSGNLWITGVKGLIERLPNGSIKRYGRNEGLFDSFGLNAIREDRDGNLWVGTHRGVARLEGSRFRADSEAEGGEPSSVHCFFEDREGNLWVGSNSGLTRFRDDLFTAFGKNEGLPNDEPSTLHQDRAGKIWVGFDNGLMLLTGGRIEVPELLHGLSGSLVFSVRETRSGELLVPSRDGLIRIKDGHAAVFVPPDSQNRKTVLEALEDRDGTLWLALPNGLGQLRGNKFRTVIPAGPLLRQNTLDTLAAGSDGSIWAGTQSNGLWRYKAGQKRLYTTADGLGSDQIRSLYQDPQNTLWVGTQDGGLHSLNDGHFVRYTARDGLPSDNIWQVADDGESLWLCTSRGISQVPKLQLRDFAAHRIKLLHPVNYGLADGLRSEQCVDGERHSDGSLWFVTRRGIAVYDPRARRTTISPPLVHIQDAFMDGRRFDWTRNPEVPAGDGRLTLHYTAIHLHAPDRVQYFYRLAGLDKDWVRADGLRAVNYDRLGHGHYQFSLRAELPGGPSGETSFTFDLLPHYYETVWFRMLGAMALAGMIWMAYKFRERQVHSRFALVLEERARLAREVHDTLAQGFVGIASQLDAVATTMPDDESPARHGLDLARRMARHSLTEARRSVMDLRAVALDDQDLAVALESGAHEWVVNSGIGVEVDVNGDAATLPEEVAHHIFRIAQEAVTNTLKHANASQVTLRLTIAPRRLSLHVADDGCGFEPQDVFTSKNGNFGLIGMRERARRLGGQLRLESHPGKGTRLEVTVPLK